MDLLERVGLQAEDIDRYPHEFSGGQKQRVALARALSVNPDMIVADEPASALDVSIQADILQLLEDLQQEFGLAILFISHDLGVIKDICDRVAVMYLGEIAEQGPVDEVFNDPQHPYTRALIDSIPTADPRKRGTSIELSGSVPTPSNPPSGCRFHTRCPEVIQPDGVDLEQSEWRSVMDLRVAVRQRRIDLEGLREFAAADLDAVGEGNLDGPEDVTPEQLVAAVRHEYDVPDQLGDPTAESALSSAIDDLVAGDYEAAQTTLSEQLSTVCEREQPALQETGAGHPAACHLHDPEHAPNRSEPAVSDD
jgi:peptide/nickel transport system ATP-binding protein